MAGWATDTDYDLVLTNRRAFVAQWAPKVGLESATLRWESAVRSLWAYLSSVPFIGLTIAGLRTSEPITTGIGICIGVCGFALIVDAGWLLRRANHLTSQKLGFKVGFRAIAPPPRGRERYETWCRKHSVIPYTAADG